MLSFLGNVHHSLKFSKRTILMNAYTVWVFKHRILYIS